MTRSRMLVPAAGLVIAALIVPPPFPAAAGDLVQEDTGIAFPSEIAVERDGVSHPLTATGVGLREATMMKVNVYAIASYVETGTRLGTDPARGILGADVAKRIHMQFVRDVEAEKVVEAYRDGVKKNMKDDAVFAADLETFLGYFTADLVKGNTITLTYIPRTGLVTELNGVEKGVLVNPALALAVWSIWFGEKPVSDGMRRDLLRRVG